METKTNTYFIDLYNRLVTTIESMPKDDPSPNLEQCLRPVRVDKHAAYPPYKNFVRAEMLAQQHSLGHDIIIAIQELALAQYFQSHANPIGYQKLIQEFRVTPAEKVRIEKLIEDNPWHGNVGTFWPFTNG